MPSLSISIGHRNFALSIPNQAIAYNERQRQARTRAQQNASRLHRRRALRRRRQLSESAGQSGEESVNYDSPLRVPMLDTEDDGEDSLLLSSFKEWTEADESKTLMNLLYAIAENQTRKGGITCNKCSTSPIRGLRYKCANCVDFDLCETCEAGNVHNSTHVFLKIRIPIPPLANPRSALLPAFYPGKEIESNSLDLSKLRDLQKKSHFDQIELEALYEQFKSLSTVEDGDGGIDKNTFEQCLGPLGLEKNLITERIFAFFDQDGDSIINFSELVTGLSVLCKGNLDEKIKYAFKGYDLDNDGYISRDELFRMFKAYFYLSMELVRDVVSAMEDDMMDNFEFSASQPVSAAFTVAIPSASSDEEDNASQNEEQVSNHETSHQNRRQNTRKEDYFQQQYAQENRYPAPRDASESSVSESSLQEEHVQAESPTNTSESNWLPSSEASPTFSIQSLAKKRQEEETEPKKPWEEKFPIMETMSQDAIEEMVEKTFRSIDTKREGYISYEEFKQFVQTDSSIVSWFEALGTVF
ncbi:hypothetical protein INT43_007267 [Umbelopsis isabellina]|uniref:EF-hand n=1 Tax=Mortierella isabellina TaxID=91625 RepID=A0A8H7PXT0_MORIS|nr:hypothetical protein INT43_007267 [Umbelopsis isabellina]